MVDPWQDLNKYQRDMEDRFTKREMIAMNLMAAMLNAYPEDSHESLASRSIQATDALLEKLRMVPNARPAK